MDKEWINPEKFKKHFFNRMEVMAAYISPGASVLDMGCGPMWLKRLLPHGCTYYPVDYIKRGDDTIVCDFNKHEFPDVKVDFVFCGGVIEYIYDYEWFIRSIRSHAVKCIASYNPVEYTPDMNTRESLNWVNSLTIREFIESFEDAGFRVNTEKTVPDPGGINELVVLFEGL